MSQALTKPRQIWSDVVRHIPQTLKMAAPIAFSQLGQNVMGLVDIFMVGKLGPESIGAVGLGNSLFYMCGLPAIGLLTALDFLVASSFGRKDLEKCNYWLVQGTYLSLLTSIPLAITIYIVSLNLTKFGVKPEVAIHTQNFLGSYCWSLIPFSLFITLKQYIQALHKVHFVTLIILIANVLNASLNWIFIYGHGVEPMGLSGSGVATFLTRMMMVGALVIYILKVGRAEKLKLEKVSLKIDVKGIRESLKIGIPSAGQMALEVGVFSLSTIIAGRLSVDALSAHTIVLNIASFTFMVPLGIAGAAAILVGHAFGRHDKNEARLAGWASFLLGVGFMSCSSIILYVFGRQILNLFTHDQAVIELGQKILLVAAFFQVFDGVQTVGTGVLRGLGETRIPLIANFFGHWVIGLPLGIFFCFYLSYGLTGLWLGLTLGLIGVALAVLWAWHSRFSKTF